MAEPTHVQKYGNQLAVLLDDGTRRLAYPTGVGLWIVSGGGGTTPPDGEWRWPFPLSLVSPANEFQTPSRPTHNGMDFSGGEASDGSPTPSAGAGTVVVANDTESYGGYGNAVVVDHGNVGPTGQRVFILYGHMKSPGPAVNVGDSVTTGQNLGPVGNTGGSFGSHCHFEIRYDVNSTSNAVNPRSFMASKGL